jgi:hypothetical protein
MPAIIESGRYEIISACSFLQVKKLEGVGGWEGEKKKKKKGTQP